MTAPTRRRRFPRRPDKEALIDHLVVMHGYKSRGKHARGGIGHRSHGYFITMHAWLHRGLHADDHFHGGDFPPGSLVNGTHVVRHEADR